ncbi:hypothetical protein ACROYT_G026568 [Oculina patagonica]
MSINVSTTTNETQLSSCRYNPTAANIGQTFVLCLIFVVSIAGNIFIGIIVYKTKTMRKPINFLIVNMAMSDVLFTIFTAPWNVTEQFDDYLLISGPLGQALCKLLPFLQDISMIVSIQSLVLIAVDRFGAVVFPLRSPLISSKLCLIVILATWIVAMAIFSPFLFANKLVEYPGGLACEDRWNEAFGESSSSVNYILATTVVFIYTPLVLLAILYTIIVLNLRSQSIPGEQSDNARQRAKCAKDGNCHCVRVCSMLGSSQYRVDSFGLFTGHKVLRLPILREPSSDSSGSIWCCGISPPSPTYQFKAVPLLRSRHLDRRDGYHLPLYLFAYKLVKYQGGLVCVRQWNEIFGDSLIHANYLLAIFVVFVYVPLVLIAILYIIIYSKLKSQTIPDEQSDNARQQRVKRERNVLKMAIAIVLGFVVCWLPSCIGWILFYFVSDSVLWLPIFLVRESNSMTSLPASELDQLSVQMSPNFSRSEFFINTRSKKRRRVRGNSNFQFSAKHTAIPEKKYPFNLLNDTEFEKSRRVLAAKCPSLVHKYGKGKKPQAAQAIDEDDEVEDALSEAGELSDSKPVGIS